MSSSRSMRVSRSSMKTAKLFVICLAFFLMGPPVTMSLPAYAGTCNIPIKGDIKQNPDSPIQIKSYFATFTMNSLNVAFVNERQTAVTAILWEVRAGNGAAFIRDVGTFSPAVIIRHCFMRYGLHAGNYVWQEQPRIRVARVKFADGTEWSVVGAPPWDDDL